MVKSESVKFEKLNKTTGGARFPAMYVVPKKLVGKKKQGLHMGKKRSATQGYKQGGVGGI